MHSLRLGLVVLAAFVAGGTPAHATSGNHIAASLVAESVSPVPGKEVRIAIRIAPEPGWHGYWSNPGDSGVPTTVRWSAPAGVRFGPLQHPAPTVLEVAGFASYVHAGPHALMVTMKVPSGVALGTRLPVTAEVSWLACSDSLCVPEKARLTLNLVAGKGEKDKVGQAVVSSGLNALPKPAVGAGTMHLADGAMVIVVPVAADPAGAVLFPAQDGAFAATAPQQVRRVGEALEFKIPTTATRVPAQFTGVVRAGGRAYAVHASPAPSALAATQPSVQAQQPVGDISAQADGVAPREAVRRSAASDATEASVTGGQRSVPGSGDGAAVSFLMALALAVIGGLILNVMPCVFPILSLKALGLAKSGQSENAARADALAFTGGTVLVCFALGSLLLLLKAAGTEVGWSFQLQSPYVVTGLLVLTTAIGLNLAGLFELRGASINGAFMSRPGVSGSFWTGALSAFIATPCSGPFMAGALGAAMVLPAPAALAVFAGLGVGMALPFLAIGFVPALRRRLPKPGAWMNTFRHLLAIPMLLTALALAWVLGRQTGVDGLIMGIAIVLAVAIALWWLGVRQRHGRERNWAVLALAAAIAAPLMFKMPAAPAIAAPIVESASRQAFSEERLAALRAKRVPVFVDFTADWCLSCKVNEKVAIETEEVQRAFGAGGVVTLVGDWTRGDPAITRFLASHGRNSIPYYLFYAPAKEPLVLPQILTPGSLSALAKPPAASG
ncbi:protein-disulfide reductase DsbD [Sphingomonas sp. BE137]|jgi:thiol:disulfide interchange protein|uniref:protein-disulfide reductase DsbD family protein n=1 Tax=Sphingomonas sp. BE137 TaxID=2817844 RepID=UPI001AE1CC5B|nr:thioredoxin family protein [Sphingomonas sp. BE137]MDR6846912.1 thiol:disulfide interchange protein [Sphingomonas sp. BE137]